MKYGKKLSTPFPEFEVEEFRCRNEAKTKQLFGAPMPEEGFFSALSVSIPVALTTPNIHDRMWPEIWCPGINWNTPQSQNLVFAAPMWERTGSKIRDYVSGALVPNVHNDLVFYSYLDEGIGGTFWQSGFGFETIFPDVVHDFSQGFSATWWMRKNFDHGTEGSDGMSHEVCFALGGEDARQFVIQWQKDFNTGVDGGIRVDFLNSNGDMVTAYWEMLNIDVPLSPLGWHHYGLSATPSAAGTTLTLYFDGSAVGSVDVDGLPVVYSGSFRIAGNINGSAGIGSGSALIGYLEGFGRDWRLYDMPITPRQVHDTWRIPEELFTPSQPILRALSVPFSFTPSGGLLGAGSADVVVSFVSTGGALLAGSADVSGGTLATTSGGVLAGGMADVTTSWVMTPSGGLVLSEYPFLYRRTITVPAGKVSENIDNFYLGVSVVLDPAKVGEPTFNITNPTLHDLPFELREYDDQTGRLTVYVRTPLTASTDTTLYLFYGAA